jgi:hypothetical protein
MEEEIDVNFKIFLMKFLHFETQRWKVGLWYSNYDTVRLHGGVIQKTIV